LAESDRTGVRVEPLDPLGRQRELAQMLGGATAAAQNAAELVARADAWKRAQAVNT
jgi:DNA repair ATPase RecN